MEKIHDKKTADTGVVAKSTRLAGKTVALGMSGGIGAIEGVKIARELRRHGAVVRVFITPQVERFITCLSLEWAAGTPVVRELGPNVDHLAQVDAVVLVPLTLHTLAKVALGLAEDPTSLLAASQLGYGRPLFLVPAMNEALSAHPQFSAYLERLKSWGAKVYPSVVEEGRIKVPAAEKLCEWLLAEMGTA